MQSRYGFAATAEPVGTTAIPAIRQPMATALINAFISDPPENQLTSGETPATTSRHGTAAGITSTDHAHTTFDDPQRKLGPTAGRQVRASRPAKTFRPNE